MPLLDWFKTNTQAFTTITAIVAACLSIYNTLQARRKERVRLRVRPITFTNEKNRLGVHIVNTGFMPVYIESATIFPSQGEAIETKIWAMEKFPFLLLPRASVQCATTIIEDEVFAKIKSVSASVETSCETIFYSPKEKIKKLQPVKRRNGSISFRILTPK